MSAAQRKLCATAIRGVVINITLMCFRSSSSHTAHTGQASIFHITDYPPTSFARSLLAPVVPAREAEFVIADLEVLVLFVALP
jgi:hypothetical protein